MNNNEELLDPVVYPAKHRGQNEARRQNVLGQHLLLKAISEGVTDPDELARIAGMKNAASVIISLDKISNRRAWHEALSRAGITLNLVAEVLQQRLLSDNERISMNAVKAVTSSLGLDRYADMSQQEKGWEETLREITTRQKEQQIAAPEADRPVTYEYQVPELPEEVKEKMRQDREDGANLFGDRRT